MTLVCDLSGKLFADNPTLTIGELIYYNGEEPPRYPVPSCIVHVDNAGLANGLEQRNPDGSLAFKIWDTPMPDGERVTGNMFDATPWSDDIDVTDWY